MGEREKYKNLIFNEPYKIGHWLGFKDLTELHNDWIRSFLLCPSDQTLQAHRGSYKTTCLSIAIALLIIVFPNKSIIFFRKTDDDVKEIIHQVAKALKSEVIRHMVQKLYGVELLILKENAFEIHTNLSVAAKGASQLIGLGIKASVTGKHGDILITDDIVNLKDRYSRAERELIKSLYQELLNIKNRGGRLINTGTPWHKDDAFSIMPASSKYDCYSTGLITKKELQELRETMTASLFAANYELKHIASEDVLFSNPKFIEEDADKLIQNGIAHIDAAYGGADGSVLTIIKKDKETGNLYVRGFRRQAHIDDCLDEYLGYVQVYRAGTIHCEDNADKGYLRKEIKEKGHIAKGYHESMNKFVKISSYLKKNWKHIYFHPSTDPEYLDEVLEYNEHADHDDSPDSLASVVRQLDKNSGWLY